MPEGREKLDPTVLAEGHDAPEVSTRETVVERPKPEQIEAAATNFVKNSDRYLGTTSFRSFARGDFSSLQPREGDDEEIVADVAEERKYVEENFAGWQSEDFQVVIKRIDVLIKYRNELVGLKKLFGLPKNIPKSELKGRIEELMKGLDDLEEV